MPTCRPSLRFIGTIAIVCLSLSSAFAQHDSTSGTAGRGSLGPAQPKTTTKPTTTRPTTTSPRRTTTPTTTTTPRRTTTTTPTTTTPKTTTANADSYEKEADEQYEAKNYDGKPIIKTRYTSADYDVVDFPVSVVKPSILKATQQAMALKLFDQMGIVQNQVGNDPIVVGQLLDPRGNRRCVTFFVAWWLDTASL